MNARTLRRLLGGYAVFLFFLCVGVRSWFALSTPSREVVVESWWKDGKRVQRTVHDVADPPKKQAPPDNAVSEEVITGEAPLYASPFLFTLGLVPGRDGVKAEPRICTCSGLSASSAPASP